MGCKPKHMGGNENGVNPPLSEENEHIMIQRSSRQMNSKQKGPCVLIDPSRRDILFAMHELSTPENPRVYRYTQTIRRRQSGVKAARQRQAHEVGNDPLVQAALVTLSALTFMSTSRGTYESYLLSRSAATPTQMNFTAEKSFGNFVFDAFCPRNNTKTVSLTTYTKFGNAILVFGDATIWDNRSHPLTPSLRIRDLLQRKGFDILLLDEYRTSSRWPLYQSEVKPFKCRQSGLIHGLLKCGSGECRAI